MPTQLNPNFNQFVCPPLKVLQEWLDMGRITDEQYQLYRQHCGYNGNPIQ